MPTLRDVLSKIPDATFGKYIPPEYKFEPRKAERDGATLPLIATPPGFGKHIKASSQVEEERSALATSSLAAPSTTFKKAPKETHQQTTSATATAAAT